MLVETYVEALLIDEDLADQVWYALDAGKISEKDAERQWMQIGVSLTRIEQPNLKD